MSGSATTSLIDLAWHLTCSRSLPRFGTYSTEAAINHGLDLEMCVFQTSDSLTIMLG